jgi:uncharacterized membrane protein YedE/YeeE
MPSPGMRVDSRQSVLLYRIAMTAMLLATSAERWPFWVGGLAVGSFVLLLLFATRNLLGVSTGFADACAAPFDPAMRRSWRIPLLLGIIAGGFVAAITTGAFSPTWSMGMFDARVTDAFVPKALVFLCGGVLLGFGARLANGCTSGHGIVGTALLAKSSWIAAAMFVVAGIVVTHLLLGGAG